MRKEIGHGAAAEVPIPTPNVKLFLAKGLIRRGSEPPLPIECPDINRFAAFPCEVVLLLVAPHLRHSSEASSLNEFHGVAKMAPTPLLHAALQDFLAGTDRANESRTFFDTVSDRLLKVNILTHSHHIDGHAHIPMIRRHNDNSIERLIKQFVVIHMHSRDAVRTLLYRITSRRINIAHSNDLIITGLVGNIEQA